MEYPTDITNEDYGNGRIHQGHGLDRDALLADLTEHCYDPRPGEEMQVREVHYRFQPRVMWCGKYDWPCDQEGEWHGHFWAVKPSETSRFTEVFWARPESVCA